ncbi:T-complex protein 1 subunit, related [Eimeria mitis]|uniref:T-complex protein 1 subunit, related n=1 Tax=Eimeria mitis TaxID=44415 RepID=U6KDP4_9EIME|nr:T-complex protein 1 subunit, related [Eimeria mitis]CDJ33608.1 T-complex protein 1 subunit, related [Eimeria mitis]
MRIVRVYAQLIRAVLAVADKERKDVNLDMIKLDGRAGGLLEQSTLVRGIVLHKDLSHSQMRKETKDAKIAILTCPFEPPKPKTKHKLDITNAADYKKLQAAEQNYFKDMIEQVKKAGANFVSIWHISPFLPCPTPPLYVVCQWGFDDEANHLLLAADIPAVRWVGGVEIEMLAIATEGRIVPRAQELSASKLGKAGCIREVPSGTMGDKMIVIQARAVESQADSVSSVGQYAARAFADALLGLAEALAANSGLSPIHEVQRIKALQQQTNCPYYGIDCMQTGTNDMREQQVWEPFASKKQQILLATQVGLKP